jgi:hypothetical protein
MGFFDKLKSTNINPFNKELSLPDYYDKLEAYYLNNRLYENINYYAYTYNLYVESMKPLRNPTHRSVEFFASKLLPGEVDVITENKSVKTAIEQFHKWSNLASQKSVASRQLALLGDLFWKVVGTDNKVYADVIHPKYVTDFDIDNRGYLTEIRLDIPQVNEDGKKYTYVEFWDKANNYWAVWNSFTSSPNNTIESLGTPDNFGFITDLGIDFIPFVHVKFSDIGKDRGSSCIEHALDKIDEANRQVTRLHELLFRNNQALWVVNSNKVDQKTGKFQAAPLINGGNPELKDNSILYMPGLTDIKSLVPSLNYADALAVLNAQMEEIASDLPEIKYFELPDNTSGKAIRLMLGSAIDRATEAQTNVIAGLKRLDEMALTIGSNIGLFIGLGTYENGDFEHSLDVGDMFPLDLDEIATALKSFTNAGLPLDVAMKKVGFSDEEIASATESNQKQQAQTLQNQQTSLAQGLMQFNRGA